ncbi:hypothetical protein KaCgl_24960 [Corynebacterium glutamicum]|uniref:hypothetical protein n=1 Tax=Corynebacterium TaxID=1716 RepID=UPI000AF03084|nr:MULTISPECIES: hypothetical protein [Corynebacterium]NII97573.1 hypothetical protein [Corynebacterium glutamicum]BCB34522.1 hypothetical protein KaCgl_24960 [Corynebacterium glutamicum]
MDQILNINTNQTGDTNYAVDIADPYVVEFFPSYTDTVENCRRDHSGAGVKCDLVQLIRDESQQQSSTGMPTVCFQDCDQEYHFRKAVRQ